MAHPRWELSTDGGDDLSNESVVFDRWHTQALRVWSDGSGKHHEFYWDLPDTESGHPGRLALELRQREST